MDFTGLDKMLEKHGAVLVLGERFGKRLIPIYQYVGGMTTPQANVIAELQDRNKTLEATINLLKKAQS